MQSNSASIDVGDHPVAGELLARHVARLTIELVDDGEDRRRLLVVDAERGEDRAQQTAVGDARAHVVRRQPAAAHDLDRDREQLGVGGDVGFADDVDVELKVLAQTAALLPLVAKELRHREPADRLAQRVRLRGRHARERRRHLRAQRDLAAALVGEVVELADDLVAALLRVELERLERRPVVFDEREPARNVAPHAHDVGAFGELFGIEIAKTGEGALGHPAKLPGRAATPATAPSRRRRCGTSR